MWAASGTWHPAAPGGVSRRGLFPSRPGAGGTGKEAEPWLRPVRAWAAHRHAQDETPENGVCIGLACMEPVRVASKEGRREDARRDPDRADRHLEAVGMKEGHPAAWLEPTDAREALGKPTGT